MLSSAVIIPDQSDQQPPPQASPSPPSLKRRQSSLSPSSSKRARLDTDNTSPIHSPPRRRTHLNGATEEKKRGQRLFSALLGTLSQTTSQRTHKKRDEIEARQRERVRLDMAEQEEQRRTKRLELDAVRRGEQEAWDAEGTRIAQRNRKAMAGFLATKTEPRLYYRPWELRVEEEERISRQREVVEEEVRGELARDAAQTMKETGMHGELHEPVALGGEKVALVNGGEEKAEEMTFDEPVENGSHESSPTAPDLQDRVLTDHVMTEDEAAAEQQQQEAEQAREDKPNPPSPDPRQKDDDHGGDGEELVEGQEDDVIY